MTGASSGFGLLTVLELAARGFQVAACVRNVDKGELLMTKAEELGVAKRIQLYQLDVTDEARVAQMSSVILSSYGRVDLLVNNAGMAIGGFAEELSMTDYREQLETNFYGAVAVTKAFLPAMRENRSGMIIQMGSISGRFGFPGYGAYAASKFALEGFSESLRHELSPYNVHVVIVEPGSFKTAIWDKGLSNMRKRLDSPYEQRLHKLAALANHSAEHAADPLEVARLIGTIAVSNRPRLRYTIGKGVRSSLLLKSILPFRALEWAIRRTLG